MKKFFRYIRAEILQLFYSLDFSIAEEILCFWVQDTCEGLDEFSQGGYFLRRNMRIYYGEDLEKEFMGVAKLEYGGDT